MPLDPKDKEFIQHVLINDEGLKNLPYFDCCGKFFRLCGCKAQGKLTIGVGRNIEDVGISDQESLHLLSNDIDERVVQVERNFGSWYSKINSARKMVIISMAFNLGINGLKEFQKMIKAIQSGDFTSASNQMLASKWSSQVKKRAVILSEIMKNGILN